MYCSPDFGVILNKSLPKVTTFWRRGAVGPHEMAALAIGHIMGEYVESREEWPKYAARLKHFLAVNRTMDEGQKTSVFLATIGPETYKLLCNVLTPEDPGNKRFADLVTTLMNYYSPKPSEIVERFKFYTRDRKKGESVVAYITELRALAQSCNYGDTLNAMLRDRLVCGIMADSIQRRLLAEPNLTLKCTLDLAIAMETAVKNSLELKHQPRSNDVTEDDAGVHKLSDLSSGRRTSKRPNACSGCYQCGNKAHTPSQCPFKDAKCFHCGKKGHVRSVCRSRTPTANKAFKQQQVKQLEPTSTTDTAETSDYDKLFMVTSDDRKRPLEVQMVSHWAWSWMRCRVVGAGGRLQTSVPGQAPAGLQDLTAHLLGREAAGVWTGASHGSMW